MAKDESSFIIDIHANHRIIHKAKPYFDHKALAFEFPNGLVEKVKIDRHLKV